MAISFQSDPINPRGYILINGQTAMTIDLSGITFQNASFNLSNNYNIISTNTSIPKNAKTAVNTFNSSLTCTLPLNPSSGDWVQIADGGGVWRTNNLILNPNGSKVNGLSGNFVCEISNQEFTLIYIDSQIGWQIAV